jgi:cysteine desulfurase
MVRSENCAMPAAQRIYLDHHATTPCDPRVVEAMLPYLTEHYGNAASRTHVFGWEAGEAVDRARAQVAALIGASAREIVFTSGATESNNLAILGVARRRGERGGHVITCRTEHPAVLDPCRALEKRGFRVTELDVDGEGRICAEQLESALEPDTLLISIMHANNEIGVIHDLAEIGRPARGREVVLHSDAAQSAGRIEVDVDALNVDLLSLSAHKLYGPKGIGALYLRGGVRRTRLEPLQYGGGHEHGLRSGTVPVALCVAFGAACEIAATELREESARIGALRDRLWQTLSGALPGLRRNGPADGLPGNLNLSIEGIEGEALLMALPEIAISSGSACTSAKAQPSHVLRAIGLSLAQSLASLRFGLGRFTTEAEVDRAAARVIEQVRRLRS